MTKRQLLMGGASAVLMIASAAAAFAQTTSTTTATTTTATTTTPTPTPTPEPTPTPTPTPAPTPTPTPAPATTTPPAPTPVPTPVPPAPRVTVKKHVEIGPAGNALIRGTVESVDASSIMVNSWGGVWTITVASGTEMLPRRRDDLAQVKPGDFIGVHGVIDRTLPWTVNAKIVRDLDAEQRIVMERKQVKTKLKEAREKARGQIKQIRKTGKEEIKQQRQGVQDLRKQLLPGRRP